MTIDALIAAAEAKAHELAEAIVALNAATQEAHGLSLPPSVVQSVIAAGVAVVGTRRRIAMETRPKGPDVALKSIGRFARDTSETGEVIRRTASTVFVRSSWGAAYQFSVESGYPTGPKESRGSWRISNADLERIRAMPVGANDVSRALKAAEAVT